MRTTFHSPGWAIMNNCSSRLVFSECQTPADLGVHYAQQREVRLFIDLDYFCLATVDVALTSISSFD